MTTTVRLVTHTHRPLATLFHLWAASRTDGPIPDPATIDEDDPEVQTFFEKMLTSDFPLCEHVSFTFLLDDVSVALREQMVRHRVGHKFGERLGVDIIPAIEGSAWWSQTTRILDMGRFAAEGRYFVPASVASSSASIGNRTVPQFYAEQMGWIQSAYNRLIQAGVPMEDARNLLPLAATHRISWTLNLQALKAVIGKRGCWIVQLGVWEPVVRGMLRELVAHVHSAFASLVSPPCMTGDVFVKCRFEADAEKRAARTDPLPPCSLYLHAPQYAARTDEWWRHADTGERMRYQQQRTAFEGFWARDPDTGERTVLTVRGRPVDDAGGAPPGIGAGGGPSASSGGSVAGAGVPGSAS